MMLNKSNQLGQAITEFNVVAAFVLVPLFIMIPLLGKYIDMKHSSVQAARYMAWERTVWFENNTKPANTTAARVKSTAKLEEETKQRFFSAVTEDELAGSDKINLLWNDRGTPLLKNVQLGFYDRKGNPGSDRMVRNKLDTQSIFYTALQGLTNLVGIVANIGELVVNLLIDGINLILNIFGFPTIPHVSDDSLINKLHYEGYYQARATMTLDNTLYKTVFDRDAVPIQSYAAVLTDSWVTEGDHQFAEWTRGLVPFSPLEGPFGLVKNVFTFKVGPFSLAPELAGLEFGFVNTDPVKDSSVTLETDDCPGGLCSFKEP